MKLYLHCGYHKTGSSFLQSLLAQERNYLIKHKIYFPISEDDQNMLDAKISEGNGRRLSNFIRELKKPQMIRLLEQWMKDARQYNCDSLLVSSEGLFHTFSREATMKMLSESCKELGIDAVEGLLFFRDPIAHVLSVYKHRGKNGTIKDFNSWVSKDYETLKLTRFFLDNCHFENINWNFRKYNANGSVLMKCVFKEWLSVPVPEHRENQRVNRSLTLSEILILAEAREFLSDFSIREMSLAFGQLQNTDKAKDTKLNRLYAKQAYDALKQYSEVIEKINLHLPDDQMLVYEEVALNEDVAKEAALSAAQIRIVVDHSKKSNSIRVKCLSFMKKMIVQVKKITN